MPKIPPTMETIARRAGVSRATVSRALRNDPRLSATTRKRVRDIARQLNYRPNPMVAALMSELRTTRTPRYTATIAFVTAFASRDGWKQGHTYREFFSGAMQRASQLGYKMETHWLHEPGMTRTRFEQMLHVRGIHGLLIAPTPVAPAELDLDWSGFAAVTFGYSVSKPPMHRVVNHQLQTISLALQRMRDLGYRRIGLVINSDSDERTNHRWRAGFLLDQDLVAPQERVNALIEPHPDERSFWRWFDNEQPDAIVGLHWGMVDWIRERGLRVPGDVGFALLDWTPEAGCAGVNQNSAIVGAAAVELLSTQLRHNEYGIPTHPRVVLIDSEWVDGPTAKSRSL